MSPRSSSWLRLDGIEFKCVIGVTERERQTAQALRVSLRVKVDFARAAAADSIHSTVDYRLLSRRVIDTGERSHFQLIETLASHLARVILDEFPAVEAVRLELEKPQALSSARSVRAVIVASRSR